MPCWTSGVGDGQRVFPEAERGDHPPAGVYDETTGEKSQKHGIAAKKPRRSQATHPADVASPVTAIAGRKCWDQHGSVSRDKVCCASAGRQSSNSERSRQIPG